MCLITINDRMSFLTAINKLCNTIQNLQRSSSISETEKSKLIHDFKSLTHGKLKFKAEYLAELFDCIEQFCFLLLQNANDFNTVYLRIALDLIPFLLIKLKIEIDLNLLIKIIDLILKIVNQHKDIHRREFLRMFADVLNMTNSDIIEKCAMQHKQEVENLNFALTGILMGTSDVETQTVVMECFISFFGQLQNITEFKLNSIVRESVCRMCLGCYQDFRMFLDRINANRTNIFSINCNAIYFKSKIRLYESQEFKDEDIWLDFDIPNSKFSLFCENTCLQSFSKYKYKSRQFEVLPVFFDQVDKSEFEFNKKEKTLTMNITMKNYSFPLSDNVRKKWNLGIVFSQYADKFNALVNSILPKVFTNFSKDVVLNQMDISSSCLNETDESNTTAIELTQNKQKKLKVSKLRKSPNLFERRTSTPLNEVPNFEENITSNENVSMEIESIAEYDKRISKLLLSSPKSIKSRCFTPLILKDVGSDKASMKSPVRTSRFIGEAPIIEKTPIGTPNSSLKVSYAELLSKETSSAPNEDILSTPKVMKWLSEHETELNSLRARQSDHDNSIEGIQLNISGNDTFETVDDIENDKKEFEIYLKEFKRQKGVFKRKPFNNKEVFKRFTKIFELSEHSSKLNDTNDTRKTKSCSTVFSSTKDKGEESKNLDALKNIPESSGITKNLELIERSTKLNDTNDTCKTKSCSTVFSSTKDNESENNLNVVESKNLDDLKNNPELSDFSLNKQVESVHSLSVQETQTLQPLENVTEKSTLSLNEPVEALTDDVRNNLNNSTVSINNASTVSLSYEILRTGERTELDFEVERSLSLTSIDETKRETKLSQHVEEENDRTVGDKMVLRSRALLYFSSESNSSLEASKKILDKNFNANKYELSPDIFDDSVKEVSQKDLSPVQSQQIVDIVEIGPLHKGSSANNSESSEKCKSSINIEIIKIFPKTVPDQTQNTIIQEQDTNLVAVNKKRELNQTLRAAKQLSPDSSELNKSLGTVKRTTVEVHAEPSKQVTEQSTNLVTKSTSLAGSQSSDYLTLKEVQEKIILKAKRSKKLTSNANIDFDKIEVLSQSPKKAIPLKKKSKPCDLIQSQSKIDSLKYQKKNEKKVAKVTRKDIKPPKTVLKETRKNVKLSTNVSKKVGTSKIQNKKIPKKLAKETRKKYKRSKTVNALKGNNSTSDKDSDSFLRADIASLNTPSSSTSTTRTVQKKNAKKVTKVTRKKNKRSKTINASIDNNIISDMESDCFLQVDVAPMESSSGSNVICDTLREVSAVVHSNKVLTPVATNIDQIKSNSQLIRILTESNREKSFSRQISAVSDNELTDITNLTFDDYMKKMKKHFNKQPTAFLERPRNVPEIDYDAILLSSSDEENRQVSESSRKRKLFDINETTYLDSFSFGDNVSPIEPKSSKKLKMSTTITKKSKAKKLKKDNDDFDLSWLPSLSKRAKNKPSKIKGGESGAVTIKDVKKSLDDLNRSFTKFTTTFKNDLNAVRSNLNKLDY